MPAVAIDITADVLAQGPVSVAMYGSVAGAWVYFDGSAYQNITSALTNVPAFATYSSADQLPATITMPDDTSIASGAFIFGISGLPQILSGGNPTEPNPIGVSTIFDVVEFSYTAAQGTTPSSLYVNTTAVNQFAMPIQIDITPASSVLPSGAGVTIGRSEVFGQYATYMADYPDFTQCLNDLFGNACAERILSPGYALQSSVAGVEAVSLPGVTGSLQPETYYYAVTALSTDQPPKESCAQYDVVTYTVAVLGDSVQVAWSNPQPWPASLVSGYNIYRGTPSGSSVTWGLIGSVGNTSFGLGDTGQALRNDNAPPMNPLNTFFDAEIEAFFTNYATNSITLTATDGTTDGYVYTFAGTVTNNVLQFSLQTVVDDKGNTVSSPSIDLGTAFNIYAPFWNSNTYDSTNPEPPSWGPNNSAPASAMVFAAMGAFADNKVQPVPSGANGNDAIYATLLGALENQVVAAITRGIANSSMNPQNWGNGTAPSLSAVVAAPLPQGHSASTLSPGTTYYYVVTAINTNGETIAGLEFNATPTGTSPCVQVTWLPLPFPQVSKFRVYRGTASQGENAYFEVANAEVPVTTWVDCGGAGTTGTPPTYFPSGGTWDAYDAFLHQPSVSINGAAYAAPYDDQGGQSSTLSNSSVTNVSISVGPWT